MLATSLVISLATSLGVSPARACSSAPPEPYAIDRALAASDNTAPTPFTELVARVERRDNKRCSHGVCTEASCPATGYVELRFRAPTDDHAGRAIGYRVVWLRGEVPPGLRSSLERSWPLDPPSDAGEGALTLNLGFREVEELDAEIALVAVDLAGNESEPSAPVVLQFSGCTVPFGGTECEAARCSVSHAGAPSGSPGSARWLALSCAALWLVRRTRRRS